MCRSHIRDSKRPYRTNCLRIVALHRLETQLCQLEIRVQSLRPQVSEEEDVGRAKGCSPTPKPVNLAAKLADDRRQGTECEAWTVLGQEREGTLPGFSQGCEAREGSDLNRPLTVCS